MSKNLNKKEIEKFSRQIILKNIGAVGQKKILSSKVLIVVWVVWVAQWQNF